LEPGTGSGANLLDVSEVLEVVIAIKSEGEATEFTGAEDVREHEEAGERGRKEEEGEKAEASRSRDTASVAWRIDIRNMVFQLGEGE